MEFLNMPPPLPLFDKVQKKFLKYIYDIKITIK